MQQNSTQRLALFIFLALLCNVLSGQESRLQDRVQETTRKRGITHRHAYHNESSGGEKILQKKVKHGFLGIREDFKSEYTEGPAIIVSENTSAAKSGLKTGDVLLKLNNTPIRFYNDVIVFMRKTTPNEAIQITYQREGVEKTTTATLEGRDDIWHTEIQKLVKEACLGVYSSTFNNNEGSKISNFTEVSAAVEAQMKVGDVITGINGIGVKTHDELWNEIAKYKPKEKVSVQYVRNNEPLRLYATLKACKPKEDVIKVEEAKNAAPNVNITLIEQRQLKLENFSASPNPIEDMVNIQFQAEAMPTTVALYDASGRMLYQQTLNDFSGYYNQRFDVSAYAKGVVLVQVSQGEKVFSKKLIVN